VGVSSLVLRPTNACLKMTRRTGRLTPAASVDVAASTETAPQAKASSTSRRSSVVRSVLW
jgi:hypothetical protein